MLRTIVIGLVFILLGCGTQDGTSTSSSGGGCSSSSDSENSGNRAITFEESIAKVGEDQRIKTGELVTLSAGNSQVGGYILWRQTKGEYASLSNPRSKTTQFIAPDVEGRDTLSFEFNIIGSNGESKKDSVNVEVVNPSFEVSKVPNGFVYYNSETSFNVTLNAKPSSPVTLFINSSGSTQVRLEPSYLIFDETNWNQTQSVRIIGEDKYAESNRSNFDIVFEPTESADNIFDNITIPSFSVEGIEFRVIAPNTRPLIAGMLNSIELNTTYNGYNSIQYSLKEHSYENLAINPDTGTIYFKPDSTLEGSSVDIEVVAEDGMKTITLPISLKIATPEPVAITIGENNISIIENNNKITIGNSESYTDTLSITRLSSDTLPNVPDEIIQLSDFFVMRIDDINASLSPFSITIDSLNLASDINLSDYDISTMRLYWLPHSNHAQWQIQSYDMFGENSQTIQFSRYGVEGIFFVGIDKKNENIARRKYRANVVLTDECTYKDESKVINTWQQGEFQYGLFNSARTYIQCKLKDRDFTFNLMGNMRNIYGDTISSDEVQEIVDNVKKILDKLYYYNLDNNDDSPSELGMTDNFNIVFRDTIDEEVIDYGSVSSFELVSPFNFLGQFNIKKYNYDKIIGAYSLPYFNFNFESNINLTSIFSSKEIYISLMAHQFFIKAQLYAMSLDEVTYNNSDIINIINYVNFINIISPFKFLSPIVSISLAMSNAFSSIYNNDNPDWIKSGTAQWFQDEVYDDDNSYIYWYSDKFNKNGFPKILAYGLSNSSAYSFSFWKLIKSHCEPFNIGSVLAVTQNASGVDALLNQSGMQCYFDNFLVKPDSLASALVYYQYATLKERSMALLDTDETKTTQQFTRFDGSTFDATFKFEPISANMHLGSNKQISLSAIPSMGAKSIIVDANSDEKEATIKFNDFTFNSSEKLMVSIISDKPFDFSLDGSDDYQEAIPHHKDERYFISFEINSNKMEFKYANPDNKKGLPELFVTIVNATDKSSNRLSSSSTTPTISMGNYYPPNITATQQTKCYNYDTYEEEICSDSHKGQDGYYSIGTPSKVLTDAEQKKLSSWVTLKLSRKVKKPWLSNENYHNCQTNPFSISCYNTSGDTAQTHCENIGEGWGTIQRKYLKKAYTHYGISNPASTHKFKESDGYWTTYIYDMPSEYYWSGTTFYDERSQATAINFKDGTVEQMPKNESYYVACMKIVIKEENSKNTRSIRESEEYIDYTIPLD